MFDLTINTVAPFVLMAIVYYMGYIDGKSKGRREGFKSGSREMGTLIAEALKPEPKTEPKK